MIPADSKDGLDDVVKCLAAHGITRSYPKNAVIITEGDTCGPLYLILSGRVKVFLSDPSGKEVALAVFGPGEYVGEMALAGTARSASVVTLEPCVLSVIAQAQFRQFVNSHPDAALHLIRKLIGRAQAATSNIRSLALMDVYGRVARLLIDLACEVDGQLMISEPLTQRDIASRVGCSREMVSRIFKDLVAGGYLRVEGRQIFICRTLPGRW